MPQTMSYRRKIKPLFDRIHGWIKASGVFKKVNQGDVLEICLNILIYERHHNKDLLSKENLARVKEYQKTIAKEYYNDAIFEEDELQ